MIPPGRPAPALVAFLAAGIALLLMTGCGKKTVPVTPPVASPPATTSTTPSAAPPELDARAEPSTIKPGESAVLIWEARNANSVVIGPNVGEVDQIGRMKVFPQKTVAYQILASGPGGKTARSVTVEVSAEIPSAAELELTGKTPEEAFAYFVKPVFFDYDSSALKDAAKVTLDGNVRWLLRPENASLKILLEGHTDSRGSAEYNLALGDKRAQLVKKYLVERGMDPSRVVTISLGEEHPFDEGTTEEAFAFNRRVQFFLAQEPSQAMQPPPPAQP